MLTRRSFLRTGAAGLGVALVGSTDSLLTSAQALAAPAGGYGPLVADPKGLLDLPRGFSYRVLTRAGDRMNGGVVPGKQDGSTSFTLDDGRVVLISNHEQSTGEDHPLKAPAALTYDPSAEGGTTTLTVAPSNALLGQYASLAGTVRNCAGGRTPWRTWLTCEETEAIQDKRHGYVFEVDPLHTANNRNPEPLTAMGRFSHEACAVDPASGTVYLTEDAGEPNGLFYRFRPNRTGGGYGHLRAGGSLEAMYVPGVPDLSMVQEPGTVLPTVQWVPVPDRDATTVSVRMQFADEQITRSHKLEGAWFSRKGMYFVASYATSEDSPGVHAGQVWFYNPRTGQLKLELCFQPDGRFDGPDNITVAQAGGLLMAEDGDGAQHVVGFDPASGATFAFARNRTNIAPAGEDPEYSEFTGPNFARRGRTFFVNIQEPGITFAIEGPWDRSPAFRPEEYAD